VRNGVRLPIHILVQKGRTTLLGVVDNGSDKTVAGLKAREITGVFAFRNRHQQTPGLYSVQGLVAVG
jgi:osmotically-inducible protein OsmY